MATLVAALIGASVGSIGAVLVADWRKAKAETSERREALTQRYLFQFQDSVESLWFRLENLTARGGRLVMADDAKRAAVQVSASPPSVPQRRGLTPSFAGCY